MGCGASAGGVKRTSVSPIMEVDLSLLRKPVLGTPVNDAKVVAASSSVTPDRHSDGTRWPDKLLTNAAEHPWLIYNVFTFLPWSQRMGGACSISNALLKLFNPDDSGAKYWRWLCDRLRIEVHLYLPRCEANVVKITDEGDFRKLFSELWHFRRRFIQEASATEVPLVDSFKVSTFCRLRPAAALTLDGVALPSSTVSTPVELPLHQRVTLLMQRDPELSRSAALKLILNKKEREGESNTCGDVQAVDSEPSTLPGFTASVLSVTAGRSGSVLTVSPGIGIRSWGFSHVFDSTAGCGQSHVYECCGLRLAVNFVNGQSGALIVYGQTGSGKTHTMFGPPENAADGIVPRIADEVLEAVEVRRSAGFSIDLGLSYVEVFGNDVTNLLGGAIGANRGENQRMGHRYVLEGRCEEAVPNREAFASMLARGEERKRSARTEMNERSTRAHTLVILRLRQKAPGLQESVTSVLSLVDLGGSERVSKSKANEKVRAPGGFVAGDVEIARVSWQEYYRCRERITETNNINKGLLTLKRCVQALRERQRCVARDGGKALPRIPFNDSKLTLLLEPALSGRSYTSIIVCCSPEDQHAEETVQSLRFGEMCGDVEHSGETSYRDISSAVAEALRQIDAEIKEVEAKIRQKEKWEWKKATRTDLVDDKNTGGTQCHKGELMELGGAGAVEIRADDGASKKETVEHVVWSQVLVGAEAENARRDDLIKTRMKLLGGAE